MYRFNYTSWKWRFLGNTILQGSVATRLRCDGIFSNHLTTNFLQNPSVKEFRKSVKIRQSYHEKFDAPFLWDTVYKIKQRILLLNQTIVITWSHFVTKMWLVLFVLLCTSRMWGVALSMSRLVGLLTVPTRLRKHWYFMTNLHAQSLMTSPCLRHRWRHTTSSAFCCDDSSRTDSVSTCSMVNMIRTLL